MGSDVGLPSWFRKASLFESPNFSAAHTSGVHTMIVATIPCQFIGALFFTFTFCESFDFQGAKISSGGPENSIRMKQCCTWTRFSGRVNQTAAGETESILRSLLRSHQRFPGDAYDSDCDPLRFD